MQTLLESAAITVMIIVVLACIGKMLGITYNIVKDCAMRAKRWMERHLHISALCGDIHGYDVDMAYMLEAPAFNAQAYAVIAYRRAQAIAQLNELMTQEKKQSIREVT